MNTVSFEDSLFILNMQIRVMRDTLCLSPPPELFLEKTVKDLQFADQTLAFLVQTLQENSALNNGNGELDNLVDAEWQFSQLLTLFFRDTCSFSVFSFPENREIITALRDNSDFRRKTLDVSLLASEPVNAEPVVSTAELSGLLGEI